MNLGELKKSLAKLPRDLDDEEVLITFVNDKGQTYDNLAFTGIIEKPVHCIVLGSIQVVEVLKKEGNLKFKPEL